MKVKDNNQLVQLLIISAITVTLIITPNLNKDSLIIPKVIILFCIALFLTPIFNKIDPTISNLLIFE
jgi:hypothetical protein